MRLTTKQLANNYKLYHFENLADAHKSGFHAGLSGEQAAFKNPVNEYQKEYNRGHKSGSYLRD